MNERAARTDVEDRLLSAAVDHFGRRGLEGASTRAIAASAGAAMSLITYHYGGKEGLYLASARHIAEQMAERVGPALAASQKAAGSAATRADALGAFIALLEHFLALMVRPESETWARFIVREQMEPSEAFDIIFDGMIGPFAGRLTELLTKADPRATDPTETRLRVIAVVGQALAFRVARAAVLRLTGWTAIGPEEAEDIKRIVRTHTLALLRPNSGDVAR